MDAGTERNPTERGLYERAVRGVRRVAALSADGGEGDAIRDALVRELRVLLELEGLSVVTREESQPSRTRRNVVRDGRPSAGPAPW